MRKSCSWSRSAIECYKSNQDCSKCQNRKFFYGKCHMPEAIKNLIENYGEPEEIIEKEELISNSKDKDKEIEEFRKIKGRRFVVSENICTEKIEERCSKEIKYVRLKQEEKDLLNLICLDDEEICEFMFITEAELQLRIKNLCEKLHAKNRTQAIVIAARMGIVNLFLLQM